MAITERIPHSPWRDTIQDTIHPHSMGTGVYGAWVEAIFPERCPFHVGDVCVVNGKHAVRVCERKQIDDFFESYTILYLGIVHEGIIFNTPVYDMRKMYSTITQ